MDSCEDTFQIGRISYFVGYGTSPLPRKTMKKTKDIQVKFFKEESIFNLFDTQSLALYRQMMADRYANLHNEEE